MHHYILAYHGGEKPSTPEEGAKSMAKWKAWLDDLGEIIVNPGTPLGMSTFISATGVLDSAGLNPMSGYSVVKAENMEAALEIAKGCPFLETGGSLQVAQVKQMKH